MDSVSEFTLISLISQLLPLHDRKYAEWESDSEEWESKIITLIIQIISLVRSMDLDSQPKPESKLMSLVTQTVSLFNSMDLDSLPEPLSKLISHISQKISADSDHKPESDLNLRSLATETLQLKPEPELISLIRQVVSVVIFMNPKLKKLICLCPQVKGYFDEGKFNLIGEDMWNLALGEVSWTSEGMWDCFIGNWDIFSFKGRESATYFYCESCNGEYHGEYEKAPAPLEIKHPLHQKHSLQLVFNFGLRTRDCYCCGEDLMKVFYYCSACDFAINIACVEKPPTLSILPRRDLLALHSKNLSLSANTMDSDSESKLISLISQVLPLHDNWHPEWASKIMPLIIQIISLVRCIDFDSQPKPESKIMSLVTQTISVFNSMDLDLLPKPLWKLILLISQIGSTYSDQKPQVSGFNLSSLVDDTLKTKPDHELVSLIRQIVSLVVIYMDPELKKLILLCPQVEVVFFQGTFGLKRVTHDTTPVGNWRCFIGNWEKFRLTGSEDATHFRCRSCNGEYHKEYEEAPLKIKHPLHPRHYLDLVWYNIWMQETRKCYCCGEDQVIMDVFYYCWACDFTMNIACVEKAPPVAHIDCPKWHEHTLALFPRRKASLICDVCALSDSDSPFYICAPCDFVVHLTCVNLPRVIRICRHPHRISFTPSFEQGDWSCRICRRKIDNDYGGFSCKRDDCLYTAHSRCATQSNVWDGVDLEGVPEEIEEEIVEPFVKISDGIIRHFSHEHHHLRLDDTIDRDYDENKQCQCTQEWELKITSKIIPIISFVRSMNLDSQPKPESKLMSLVSQTISPFNSMDFNSLPEPLSELISFISKKILDSDQKPESDMKVKTLVDQTLRLKPEPELISLIRQIVSLVISTNAKLKKFISIGTQVEVLFNEWKFHVTGEVPWTCDEKWKCFLGKWKIIGSTGEDATYFLCKRCNGEYHKEYEKAPLEIKHTLHQKHSLQLVLNEDIMETRECYCCDVDLMKLFYYSSV